VKLIRVTLTMQIFVAWSPVDRRGTRAASRVSAERDDVSVGQENCIGVMTVGDVWIIQKFKD